MAFVQKFMHATGKLRAVFGPANRSALDVPSHQVGDSRVIGAALMAAWMRLVL
jgi:hypothetical protein